MIKITRTIGERCWLIDACLLSSHLKKKKKRTDPKGGYRAQKITEIYQVTYIKFD